MMDETWVWEKVKKKRFLLSFVQSGWKEGWEGVQTAGMGVGSRALVSVLRACVVYGTPEWKRHTDLGYGREGVQAGGAHVRVLMHSDLRKSARRAGTNKGCWEQGATRHKVQAERKGRSRSDAEPEGFSVLWCPLPSSAPLESRGPLSNWRIFSLEPKGMRQRNVEMAVRH